MALTLVRPQARPERARRLHTAAHVTTGPVGILVAACALTTGFLMAVSDLVTRLG